MFSPPSDSKRFRNGILVGVAIASIVSTASASSLLEVYGSFTGTGTIKADITAVSWRADTLEWTLGTYSHSGGTLSSGGAIPGGGIDSVLNVSRGGSVLASSDNLSATNFDSEVRTPTVSGRPGSIALPSQVWASSFNVGLSPKSASALGDGKFSLVSYVPGDATQDIKNFVLPATASLTGIYATETRVIASAGHGLNIADRLYLNSNSVLHVQDGDVISKNVTMLQSSIQIASSGSLNVETFDLGDGENDRGTISLTGTGGINAQSTYLATSRVNAAVTVNHQSGNFITTFLMMDRPEAGGATSHYNLYGGMLSVESLSLYDAILHVSGGTLSVPWLGTIGNSLIENKIKWDSGTIAVTSANNSILATNAEFGSNVALTAGRTLSLNAPGLTSFVTLTGGKLALRELANNGLAMDWQSGEVHVTGTAGATIGVGKALGDQLALRQDMTLRVAGTLTSEAFSRLIVNDGAKVYAGAMVNGGELALQSTGGSVNIAGTLTNNGIIRGSGRISGTLANQLNARVEIDADDSLRLVGNLQNSGQIRLTGGELLLSGFSLVNNATGKITGRGVIGAGTIDNRGTITLSAGLSDIDSPLLTNLANAKTIVTGTANATFYGNVTNETGAEFRISADSRATFLGTVTNLAAFTGTGVKVFDGPASGSSLMTGGDTEVEPGGVLTVAGIRENAFTVRGSATIASNSAVSRVNEFTLEGGTLDIRNNTLVVDYATASPLAAIQAAAVSRDLFSSVNDPRTAVAVAEARDLNRTVIGGVALDSTSLVIALALKGDANIDSKVNFDDLLTLAQNYGKIARNWAQGDFTSDAAVNFDDLLTLAQNYNGTLLEDGSIAIAAASDVSFANDFALAVSLAPEPGSLLAMSGLLMFAKRRR